MGIKQPPNYVHPNKKKKEDKPNVDLMHERAALKRQSVAPVKRNKVSKSSKGSQSKSSQMILIRLVAKPPLPGQIKIYDNMVAGGLSSKQAILGLFKRDDLRPNSPPVIWRIRQFVFGLMQPVFATPFSLWHFGRTHWV